MEIVKKEGGKSCNTQHRNKQKVWFFLLFFLTAREGKKKIKNTLHFRLNVAGICVMLPM